MDRNRLQIFWSTQKLKYFRKKKEMFSLSRKLKTDGNKCHNKWENKFLAQVAKEKVTIFVQFLSLQFSERNFFIFFMLLFLPLKYLNNKNTLDKGYTGKKNYFSSNFVFWEIFTFERWSTNLKSCSSNSVFWKTFTFERWSSNLKRCLSLFWYLSFFSLASL